MFFLILKIFRGDNRFMAIIIAPDFTSLPKRTSTSGWITLAKEETLISFSCIASSIKGVLLIMDSTVSCIVLMLYFKQNVIFRKYIVNILKKVLSSRTCSNSCNFDTSSFLSLLILLFSASILFIAIFIRTLSVCIRKGLNNIP